MSKEVSIHLTAKQFNLLCLYAHIGLFVEDHVTEGKEGINKSPAQTLEEMEVFQALAKSAYQSKLKGAFLDESDEEKIYIYGRDIEERADALLEAYDKYVESGEKAKWEAAIEQHVKQLEKDGLL